MTHVAYEDAEAYAAWAGKELPTEAEWEFAARGGLDGADFAWGDEFAPRGRLMANTWQGEFPWQNLARRRLRRAPRRSESFPPNGYGLFDMAGNVWEWTSRLLHADAPRRGGHAVLRARSNPRVVDPTRASTWRSPARNPAEVIKGGSHLCAPNYCLATARRRVRASRRHLDEPHRLPLRRAHGRDAMNTAASPTAGGAPSGTSAAALEEGSGPPNAKKVLPTLILVAGGGKPEPLGRQRRLAGHRQIVQSSQTTLDLIAVGYSLGLAASVLWFGALGDRYGRKLMIILGRRSRSRRRSSPAVAPSDTVLFGARLVGAWPRMAYPTTLALITALVVGVVRGPADRPLVRARRRGGGSRATRSGLLLLYFSWGSVFVVKVPSRCWHCSWRNALCRHT